MTVKASISLTDAQDAFARSLVAQGHYPSLSAVLQHGLEILRTETETKRVEIEALRLLMEERRRGRFISLEEGKAQTQAMLARKRAELGLSD
jgi:antitoxin ParD1/3/4